MSDRLRAALQKLRDMRPASLEELLTGREYFSLETASPIQRAICRIADGVPIGSLANDPTVIAAVGDCSQLPDGPPNEIGVISAIRTGKSLFAACLGVHWSQTCDVSRLGAGETPRISIVSLKMDLAQVVFGHIVGNILARPKLASLLLEKPGTDSVLLRHPSGRPVEIKVVAGSRAGSSLVARWSAGCIFDEATRMVGSDEGVINYDDARAAVLARLLPGSQLVYIGSPWAPYGPVYDQVTEFWKHPSKRLVIVRAPGWDFNPIYWTPERCDDLKKNAPEVWTTDCAAQFATPEESMFATSDIEACTRREPLVLRPVPGAEYTAAMDPATRGNSWTLVIATKAADRRIVVLSRQWTGSAVEPLSPKAVLAEIHGICQPYGIAGVWTDQHLGDALRDIAKDLGLGIWLTNWTDTQRTDKYNSLKTRVQLHQVELPLDAVLQADLKRVKRRTTTKGVTIVLPKTSDGRHCDFAPSVVLALSRYLDDPHVEVKIQPDSPEAHRIEAKDMLKRAIKKHGRPKVDIRRIRWHS